MTETETAPGLEATDFLAAQRANRRNTDLLVLILLGLGAAFGYLAGWTVETMMLGPEAAYATADLGRFSPYGFIGGGALLSIGCAATAVTYAAGGRVLLGLLGADLVSEDAEPQLHNVVEEMAIAAGLPKPRVTVIETPALNAFATGMDEGSATIGVTRGLLGALNREELQGVVAHETGHILNADIRYMTAVAMLVGLIALLCDGALRVLRHGARRKGAIVLAPLLVFAILAPVVSQVVRFAVSRQREYLADATAVQLARNPMGLIGALRKLGASAEPFRGVNRATQHIFIVNPFREFDDSALGLFATHPSIEARIERLRNLG
jgi:heat shock protein HtpX